MQQLGTTCPSASVYFTAQSPTSKHIQTIPLSGKLSKKLFILNARLCITVPVHFVPPWGEEHTICYPRSVLRTVSWEHRVVNLWAHCLASKHLTGPASTSFQTHTPPHPTPHTHSYTAPENDTKRSDSCHRHALYTFWILWTLRRCRETDPFHDKNRNHNTAPPVESLSHLKG